MSHANRPQNEEAQFLECLRKLHEAQKGTRLPGFLPINPEILRDIALELGVSDDEAAAYIQQHIDSL